MFLLLFLQRCANVCYPQGLVHLVSLIPVWLLVRWGQRRVDEGADRLWLALIPAGVHLRHKLGVSLPPPNSPRQNQ